MRAPVSVGPADVAFTRTPCGANSKAQHRVRCSRAALLAPPCRRCYSPLILAVATKRALGIWPTLSWV
jgi:hypothetical protein